ncbi:MAG: hypothetical protein ABWZ66_00130 [Pyrinomonadaceae bacterium]
MKNLITVVMFSLFIFSGSAYSQKNNKDVVKFSSQYSNLNKDCKTIKGATEGTDDASDCKGVGGYRMRVWAAAAALYIAAETPDKQSRIQLATQNFDFDQTKSTIEWRMANGKPFAIIMRVAVYSNAVKEGEYFGKKIGEELIVTGLKGYEKIDFKVDAKTSDANARARGLADDAYLNTLKKTIRLVL